MELQTIPKPTHKLFIDLEGQRYGRLVVVSLADRRHNAFRWNCRCDCGTTTVVARGSLTRGLTLSCGCYNREAKSRLHHGDNRRGKRTPEYQAYHGAKQRCTNPNAARYRFYGGRGIKFLFTSFPEFLAELGRRPSPDYSLDRIDSDGDYTPGNVRWAPDELQKENRRSTVWLMFNGQLTSVTQVAQKTGLKSATITGRKRRGWCDICAASHVKSCPHT